MRNDVAGLRTWLLATFAGWAMLVWAACLFGPEPATVRQ